jgi:tRNA pseudouridine55 synthase
MDGVLLIDKPAGMTSHDVVAGVRRTLGVRRVGHTGTLDPFATGLLVLLIGRATRLAQFLSGAEKEYEATIRLGYATDTGDNTGQRLPATGAADWRDCTSVTERDIAAALASLRGEIEQTPPMYSAKKVKGQKLYELARRGETVDRIAVRVNVSQFEAMFLNGQLLRFDKDGSCELAVRVVCSAGTYVRTLAESVGEFLRTGAHLSQLRRTRAGRFDVANAITLEELKRKSVEEITDGLLLSPDAALSHLPAVTLGVDDARRTCNGVGVQVSVISEAWAHTAPVRMQDPNGDLLAVGFYDEVKEVLQPTVVIAPE